jgi:hypothetical protein
MCPEIGIDIIVPCTFFSPYSFCKKSTYILLAFPYRSIYLGDGGRLDLNLTLISFFFFFFFFFLKVSKQIIVC